MTVENTARRIGDRLVEIVAFDEDGEKTGDTATAKIAGAFEHFGQDRKNRRRVSFLTGRLTGGQPNFALRHSQTSYRIHDEKDVLALVAKILSDRQRNE